MIDEGRGRGRLTMSALAAHLEAGTPIVGLAPSCLFTFRDEYAAMFPGDRLASLVSRAQLIDESLAAELRAGRIAAPWKSGPARSIRAHGHCHQKAFDAFDATLELLRSVPGAQVAAIESSCCGMAGALGHEKGHYDISMKIAELALVPAVRGPPAAGAAPAGTSCPHPIAHAPPRAPRCPRAWLRSALFGASIARGSTRCSPAFRSRRCWERTATGVPACSRISPAGASSAPRPSSRCPGRRSSLRPRA